METAIVTQALSPAPPPEASQRLTTSFGREVDALLAAVVAAASGLGSKIDVRA